MRQLGAAVIGVVGGFFVGLILSEIIGVVGFIGFHQVVGFRFLPVLTAAVGMALAVWVTGRNVSR